MKIATVKLHHNDLRDRAKLKLIALQYRNVSFTKLSKTKTEVTSPNYKAIQNVVMRYLGTNDTDIADAIIYIKNE